jgi:hypothetical protein
MTNPAVETRSIGLPAGASVSFRIIFFARHRDQPAGGTATNQTDGRLGFIILRPNPS